MFTRFLFIFRDMWRAKFLKLSPSIFQYLLTSRKKQRHHQETSWIKSNLWQEVQKVKAVTKYCKETTADHQSQKFKELIKRISIFTTHQKFPFWNGIYFLKRNNIWSKFGKKYQIFFLFWKRRVYKIIYKYMVCI